MNSTFSSSSTKDFSRASSLQHCDSIIEVLYKRAQFTGVTIICAASSDVSDSLKPLQIPFESLKRYLESHLLNVKCVVQ